MAKKATGQRARTATPINHQQVQRVRDRLAGDEYWLAEIRRAIRPVERLNGSLRRYQHRAVWAHGFTPRELRDFGPEMRALAAFAKLVARVKRKGKGAMPEPERQVAWAAIYVSLTQALKATRRRSDPE